jgi:hypothetical protein
MKMESQKQQHHVFFLATENVFIHVNEPFKIQQDMIETRNFIPEASMIRHFQEYNKAGIDCYSFLKLTKGEKLMPAFEALSIEDSELFSGVVSPFSLADEDDTEDEDWDEDDEDWDDEDEDWDEDDEEWDDEEEEEWEDEEDEDLEDEDEDWEEDEEEE